MKRAKQWFSKFGAQGYDAVTIREACLVLVARVFANTCCPAIAQVPFSEEFDSETTWTHGDINQKWEFYTSAYVNGRTVFGVPPIKLTDSAGNTFARLTLTSSGNANP